MSSDLHYAAAPRDRCQSLPKVRHAAWQCDTRRSSLICHRFMSQVFGMCHWKPEVSRSIVACQVSVTTESATRSVTLSQVLSQVWHVPWRLCVRCHRFGMWCVRCHRFGMCHGVCASMSWRLCVRCHACHVMLKLPLRWQRHAVLSYVLFS